MQELLSQSGIEQMRQPDTCFLQLLADDRARRPTSSGWSSVACPLESDDALLFARIVRRIHVGDGEGPLSVDLDYSVVRSPGIVVHLGCRLCKPAGSQRDFCGSSLSPMPMLNVPESTVTYSVVG
jgi:hypothetical protein